jgi:nucleoside-diphosphate-sugar epimerase
VRILVTGASGFIGRRLCETLLLRDYEVVPAVRHGAVAGEIAVGNVGPETEWRHALTPIPDVVIHLAALINPTRRERADLIGLYRATNVEGTIHLARQAAAANVRRLIYLSSAKVDSQIMSGLSQNLASSAGHFDLEYAYGVSKWEAEQALSEISGKTGLQIVVVRPPLVYGPGVKGNLARLLKLVRLGFPLPFGAVQNKRSLIGLDNLVDLLIRCVDHPAAAGQTFLVSDGEDLSTPDLLRCMAAAMDRSARFFPVPASLLRIAGSALGKRAEIERLVGSLQIDSGRTRQILGWTPPVSVHEGIRRMVQGT